MKGRAWRRHDWWRERLRAEGLGERLAAGLGAYLELLGRWGGATDLVGPTSVAELVSDHVRESLAAARWLPRAGRLLDVGSGNGFPAVPLLLARPAIEGVLLEPRERRWAFLKEAVRELGLTAEVRRERLAAHVGLGYAAVTVRGVALGDWQPHVERAMAEGGRVLWWTGAALARELAASLPARAVLTCPLPNPARGVLLVWRRRST